MGNESEAGDTDSVHKVMEQCTKSTVTPNLMVVKP